MKTLKTLSAILLLAIVLIACENETEEIITEEVAILEDDLVINPVLTEEEKQALPDESDKDEDGAYVGSVDTRERVWIPLCSNRCEKFNNKLNFRKKHGLKDGQGLCLSKDKKLVERCF